MLHPRPVDTTRLFYTEINLNDNHPFDLKYNELNITDAYGISLSPDKSLLLVNVIGKDLEYYCKIIDIENNQIRNIEKLDGYEVLNWFSDNELLCIKDNELFLFDLSKENLSEFDHTLDLSEFRIANTSSINQNQAIFHLTKNYDEDYKEDGPNELLVYDTGSFKKIYSVESPRLDYSISNNEELMVLKQTIITGKTNSELVIMNFDGQEIDSINLSNLLRRKPVQSNQPDIKFIRLSENIVNDHAIVYCGDPYGNHAYYKVYLKQEYSAELLFDEPPLSHPQMIRLF